MPASTSTTAPSGDAGNADSALEEVAFEAGEGRVAAGLVGPVVTREDYAGGENRPAVASHPFGALSENLNRGRSWAGRLREAGRLQPIRRWQ